LPLVESIGVGLGFAILMAIVWLVAKVVTKGVSLFGKRHQ
jgi:hypothetical protein